MSPEWLRFRDWFKQYCRWRWLPGRFVVPTNPDGVVSGDEMCALCFAALDRGGYPTGDSQIGEPPDWCQYYLAPNGFWAAICFNPFANGYHRYDYGKDGKLRYSNDDNLTVIPTNNYK